MKKFLSFITALLIAAAPLSVLGEDSPTTTNNNGGYDGCATDNIALAARGCTAYVNGQWVTSLGDGTYYTTAGNVFDANGRFLYNLNGGATVSQASASEFHFVRGVNDNVTFDHFIGINVDDVWVDPSNYTARRGSVIVTLKQDFLNTLAEGTHTITAMFDDSEPLTKTFTITKTAAGNGKRNGVPNTGEQSHAVYYVMFAGAMIVMAGAGYILYTNKH